MSNLGLKVRSCITYWIVIQHRLLMKPSVLCTMQFVLFATLFAITVLYMVAVLLKLAVLWQLPRLQTRYGVTAAFVKDTRA